MDSNHEKGEIYPDVIRCPYYIVSPPYSRFSAGVKVLHLLCHALNQRGQQAFMLIVPDMPAGCSVVHPDLLSPRLTQDIMDAHAAAQRTPVVVYPEIIRGNPLKAPFVVRYLLNFPGLLGGDADIDVGELVFVYSEVLAKDVGQGALPLFLPVTNTRIYNRNGESIARTGSCYYARKYKQLHAEDFCPPEQGSIEITWDQSPEELADIYRRVEKFYCYENTSSALDAALCGCPVVFVPNEHLAAVIGEGALGTDGAAWGSSPAEFERAKASVGQVFTNYQRSLGEFWSQLETFISKTQECAAKTPYATKLRSPLASRRYFGEFFSAWAIARGFVWRGEMTLMFVKTLRTIRQHGVKAVIRKIQRGTI